MSEQKHTPGPWAVNPFSAQVDAMPSMLPVCKLLWPTDKRTKNETEANGHLIAAAPELLNACKRAYANMPEGPCANELREVIAKAEGKQ